MIGLSIALYQNSISYNQSVLFAWMTYIIYSVPFFKSKTIMFHMCQDDERLFYTLLQMKKCSFWMWQQLVVSFVLAI